MKSESKKFYPKKYEKTDEYITTVDTTNPPKEVEKHKEWLISYELYRVTTGITTRVDVGTRIVSGRNLKSAYESLKIENHKVIIISLYEL